uniref:Acyl-CoA binding domain containing 4 n=1 Tax=Pipistrellus kuhlii TaxID=59472 RepID=A0A7J7U6Y8_PIPKU|nr:acyl-CoA binding domain containing 4 [Pipistrellus kuhlii]
MGTEKEIPEPDCQKQFQAAVRVIQNLPKNNSYYRPSYEEMLRFYSYYKQATMGPCRAPRPGFWDPIGRYKWDAWNSLGKMSREEAMFAYITEMKVVAKKVIDTVPLGEVADDMFGYFEPLYQSLSHPGTRTLRFSVIPWSSWSPSWSGQSRRAHLEESLTPESALCPQRGKRGSEAACRGRRNWTRGWWGQFEHCRRACGTSRGDCKAWRACHPPARSRGPHPAIGPGLSGSQALRCSSSSCGPSLSSGSSGSSGP